MRVNDPALRRVRREFLAVLAVARGLYFRLSDLRKDEGLILDRLKPALDQTAACLERIAADPHAAADPRKTRDELLAARKTLGAAADALAAEVGKSPLDPLANGLLILHRAGDMLHGLSMVMVAETATLRAAGRGQRPSRPIGPAPYVNTGAVMQGVRAALALLIISVFWAATTWSAGFWAVTGLGIMLIVLVNQEEPGRLGWPYLGSVVVAILVAYAALVFVLPRLEGFDALAIFMILALLPAGLMMGSPRYAIAGMGFGSFFAAEIGTGNVFQPDPQAYMNNALGLVFGMGVCMIVAAGLMPIDWPGRAAVPGRRSSEPCPGPRASGRSARSRATSSPCSGYWLTRLHLDLPVQPDPASRSLWPPPPPAWSSGACTTARTIPPCRRPRGRRSRPASIIWRRLSRVWQSAARSGPRSAPDAETAVLTARTALAALPLEPGSPAARMAVRAAASLRFIGDRFGIDRPFLLRSFGAA